jgi:photosystem II stability/assembly factor-like uncharacterized protein
MERKMRTLKIYLLVFILSTTISAQWEWKNPLPQANILKKIFFTDSSSGWMVGDKGTFLKTVNDSVWEVKYYDSVRANLTSVTFRNSNLGWAVSAVVGVVEDGRVFKTSDGGQNWVQVSIFNKDLYDVKFVTDDIGWVVGFGIISKTTDGGISWTDQLLDPSGRFYTCYFTDLLKGWAVGYAGTDIYHTEDGGVNWTQLNLSSSGIYFSIAFSGNSNGWIAGQTTEGIPQALLYRSTDGGESWIDYPLSGKGLSNITFVEDSIGWITNEDGNIIKTSDGGTTWTTISSVGSYINHIFFTDTERGWLVHPNGVIRKTVDGGSTWITQSSGFRFNIESSFFVDSLRGTIIQPSGTLLYTQDGTKTWTVSHDPPYADYLHKITFVDSLYGWACGYRHNPYPTLPGPLIVRTTNGGQSWLGYQPPAFGLGGHLFVLEFVNRQVGFTSCYGIWRCTDGGWNWTNVYPNAGYIYDIFFLSSTKGWATEEGGIILKTTDGGNSWEQIRPGVAIHTLFFLNEYNGWGDNGSLLQTTDGGYTWQVQVENIGTISSYCIVDENNFWLVGGKSLRTTDGGQSWESYWHPSSYAISSVQFINNKIGWFSGGEGTILKYYNDESSGIENEEFENVILNYSLSNNYPNPFNPATKIKYTIPSVTLRQTQSDIKVILKVYDILGREIATLVNEEKPAGEYEVEFHAANLPSGIYFYQLSAGDYRETKKMILLK